MQADRGPAAKAAGFSFWNRPGVASDGIFAPATERRLAIRVSDGRGNPPPRKETHMRVVTIVAALLVGTAGFAMAQTSTSPGTSSGASSAGQCWDVSSNQVRSKTGGSSNTASNT